MIMNPVELCRLCLSTTKLVDLFDPRLTSAAYLRKCVLVSTGIQICTDDTVSRFICHECCYLISLQHDFRQRALQSSRSIKLYQAAKTALKQEELKKKEVVKKTITALKQEELKKKEVVKKTIKLPVILPKWTSVHHSVKSLFESYSKLKIPLEVIRLNVSPRLVLTKVDSASFVERKEPDKTERMPFKCQRKSTSQKFFKCDHCNLCFSNKSKLKRHRKLHKQCILCLKWSWAINFKRHYDKCLQTIQTPTLSLVKIDDEYPMLKPFIKFNMCDKITLKKISSDALTSNDEVDVIEVIPHDEDDELLDSLIAENGICLSMLSVPNSCEAEYSVLNAEIRKGVLKSRAEIAHISSIFHKYANIPNSLVTPYNLDSIVSYATPDGGGVVKSIASELQHFYIPIQFRIGEERDVRVCLNGSAAFKNDAFDFFDWSIYEVQPFNSNERIKESGSDSNLDSGIFRELCDDLSQYPSIRVKAPWECNMIY